MRKMKFLAGLMSATIALSIAPVYALEQSTEEIDLVQWTNDNGEIMTMSSEEYSAEVVRLVNVERAKDGLYQLTTFDELTQAANTRAEELVERYDHDRPDGSSCYTALDELNIDYRAAGENIAVGQGSPQAVVDSWMKSLGHRGNILNSNFRSLGAGYHYDASTIYRYHWAQLFISNEAVVNATPRLNTTATTYDLSYTDDYKILFHTNGTQTLSSAKINNEEITLTEDVKYNYLFETITNAQLKDLGVGTHKMDLVLSNGAEFEFIINITDNFNLGTATITGIDASYVETFVAITPTPVININDETLILNTDYTVSYSNNTNVGTATITITGKGNYTGTQTVNFEITAKPSVSDAIITNFNASYIETGSAITPDILVTLDGEELILDTDYTVSYSNNTNIGTASIVITGKDDYKGTQTVNFEILDKPSVANAVIEIIGEESYIETFEAITPDVLVTFEGETLILDTDYTISYENNVEVGTASVIISGINEYGGTQTVNFEILDKPSVSDALISGFELSVVETFEAIEPSVILLYNGQELILGTDYTIAYENNVEVGDATIVITGINEYKGTHISHFEITAKPSVENADIIGIDDSYTLDENYEISSDTVVFTVEFDSKTLVLDEDYTVSYSINAETGLGSVTITGINDYKGEITKTFTIIDPRKQDLAFEITSSNALKVGNSLTLTTNVDGDITFTTSDELIVSVNGSTAKALNAGNATITAIREADENYNIAQDTMVITVTESSSSGGSSSGGSSSGGSSSGSSSSTDTETDVETDVETEETTTPKVEGMTDISPSAWYYEAVDFVLEYGLFAGATENEFRPEEKMSRAMLWTVLYRYNGGNGVTTGANWYEESQKWATLTGISDGTNPNDDMTREQLATILYRFEKANAPTNSAINTYPDGENVSSWAVDALNWAVNEGLIQGDLNGSLNPTNTATRAEVATILMRYIAE